MKVLKIEILGLSFLLGTAASLCASAPQGPVPAPATGSVDRQKLDEPAAQYEKLLQEHPESAELWSNLGVVRAMAGNCREALPALQRAESLNVSLFNPWFFAGYCYFALHQSQRAMESIERATRLNPKDPNAWLLRAQVSSDLGNLKDSLDAVVRSQSLGPVAGGAPALPGRAEAYYLAGKDALELATGFYEHVMEVAPQPEFYALFLDGQRNAAAGGWESAINEYQRALRMTADQPDLYFAMGTAHLGKGQYEDAENSFKRCLELAPHSTWARLRLALGLLKQAKQAEALSVCRAISLNDLQSPSEHQDFLSCAYLLRLPDVAKAALAQARRRFPHDGEWNEWSARLASGPMGHSQDAAGEEVPAGSWRYDDALPLKVEALTGVGLSLRFWLTAKQEKGNVFASLFAAPVAYQKFRSDFLNGRWAAATEKIVPLLKTEKPTGAPARAFAMGQILQSLSYGFYEQLGAEFPDSPPAVRLAADNLLAAGQREKALEIYKAMVQKDGQSPDILREMARIYWEDHKWDQALEALQPLVQMDPNDATVFVNIGRIYASEQKSESAAEAFRRAIRIEPRMSEAHLGLGQVLRGQGDLQGALQELQLASRIDPLEPRAHYVLSQIYSKVGEKELAAQEMASFQRLRATASSEAAQRKILLVPLD